MPRGRRPRPNPFNTEAAKAQADVVVETTKSYYGRVRFPRLAPWANQRILMGRDGAPPTATPISGSVDPQLLTTLTGTNPQLRELDPKVKPRPRCPTPEPIGPRRRAPKRPRLEPPTAATSSSSPISSSFPSPSIHHSPSPSSPTSSSNQSPPETSTAKTPVADIQKEYIESYRGVFKFMSHLSTFLIEKGHFEEEEDLSAAVPGLPQIETDDVLAMGRQVTANITTMMEKALSVLDRIIPEKTSTDELSVQTDAAPTTDSTTNTTVVGYTTAASQTSSPSHASSSTNTIIISHDIAATQTSRSSSSAATQTSSSADTTSATQTTSTIYTTNASQTVAVALATAAAQTSPLILTADGTQTPIAVGNTSGTQTIAPSPDVTPLRRSPRLRPRHSSPASSSSSTSLPRSSQDIASPIAFDISPPHRRRPVYRPVQRTPPGAPPRAPPEQTPPAAVRPTRTGPSPPVAFTISPPRKRPGSSSSDESPTKRSRR